MKKILFGALIAGVALADDGTVANERTVDGFYAGLGLCFDHSVNKLKTLDGVDGAGNTLELNYSISDRSADQFGVSVVAGYGKCFSGFYLGGEVLLDIAENKSVNATYVDPEDPTVEYPYYSQVSGFIPTFALRLGWHWAAINSLVYAKAGIAIVKTEYQEKDPVYIQNVRKMNKIAPLVGIGFEKKFCKGFNLRGEFEYRFRAKKTSVSEITTGEWFNVENTLRGIGVRLMATYNF